MRFYYLIFLYYFITPFSFSQTNEQEDKSKLVRNNIKSKTQWIYKYRSGILNKEGHKNYYIKYDKKGNPLEITYYKPGGQISLKLTYKYDHSGNKIEYISYDGDKKSVTYKQAIKYNEEGKKMREIGFDGSNPYKIVYNYNHKGNIKEIINYKHDGSIDEKRIFNREGLVTTISIYKSGKILTSKLVQKYNSDGKILEDITYDASNKVLKKIIFDYNQNGALLHKKEYRYGNFIFQEDYEYNTTAKLINVFRKESQGDIFLNNNYIYYPNGDLQEERWFDGDPDDYSSRNYTYDKKGNLIKMDCYYSFYKYKVLYKYSYDYN